MSRRVVELERIDGSEHLTEDLGCHFRPEGGIGVKAVIMAVCFTSLTCSLDLSLFSSVARAPSDPR
jgi:hypothetical protein